MNVFRRLRSRWRWWQRGRRRAALARAGELQAKPIIHRQHDRDTDSLSVALSRLQQAAAEPGARHLALAWYALDEAKAAVAGYRASDEPPTAAVLEEECPIAQRVWRRETGLAPSLSSLLEQRTDGLEMLRYRLLVGRLPRAVAQGGRSARAAIAAAYRLMARSEGVPSPYGRWLLAYAVCTVSRDQEELARQTELYRSVTTDHRGADGAVMQFVAGGEFIMPAPVSLTALLDLPGLPTRLEALKHDAPPDITRLFMGLTPRSRQRFVRAFQRREDAYLTGRPWGKPPRTEGEGTVFVGLRTLISPFFVDRQPVSGAAFAAFVGKHPVWRPDQVSRFAVDRDTYLRSWHGNHPPENEVDRPITAISYQAARAYLAAYGKDLPTEAQWLLAATGPDIPETRLQLGDGRPYMSDEDRRLANEAAARGFDLSLAERVNDFDGLRPPLPYEPQVLVANPQGPATGQARLWRTPTGRGRVADVACEANVTFRGLLPASAVWVADQSIASLTGLTPQSS